MDRKLNSLYRLGGLTGILSGFLMLASSIWFIFDLASIFSLPSEERFELIGKIGVFHGIGVLTLILLIPTLLASYGLLSSEASTRSLLGAMFAVSWLIIELIAHCSQTAPLGELSKLASEPSTASSIREALYTLWAEWGESLFMTSAFLCVLFALCYGSALKAWGNSIASYLFFISIVAFPVGVILFDFDTQLHVLTRGIAFLFLGGVLLQAPTEGEV